MFKLLSKESNIFSIPLYIGFLLLIITGLNVLNFNGLDIISAIITVAGVALSYFLFNTINLNYQTHLPLFLYTFIFFALYPGKLDIGIATTLFTNSFLLLILTGNNEELRKNAYLPIGAILALNYIFLPASWPLTIFVILHIFATSGRIALNIFRLFFGALMVFLAYFSLMYFLGYTTFNSAYFPFSFSGITKYFYPLYLLSPVILLLIFSVIDHFRHYNEKSPESRYKYTFLLIFSFAQLISIILYMGKTDDFLVLLAFPSAVILSRMLRFLPKYWMKEAGIWAILIVLMVYKIGTFFNFDFL